MFLFWTRFCCGWIKYIICTFFYLLSCNIIKLTNSSLKLKSICRILKTNFIFLYQNGRTTVTIASGKAKKEVIMVDPAEAKRLAAKQMEAIKKKQSFERRRQIEAVNGAWAMLGLTAGLVIEGQTGNGILAQLTGYWAAVVSFFVR